MRIGNTTCEKRKLTKLEIKAGEGEDLTPVEAALNNHMWVRLDKHGKLETSPGHRKPVVTYDYAIDPHWHKREKPKLKYRPDPSKRAHKYDDDDKYDHRSIYVHSIHGYSGNKTHYWGREVSKATVLRFMGFIPLRSTRGKDGRFWEVWYLPSISFAESDLKGKTTKYIIDWLYQVIRPGNVHLEGDSYALPVPD